MKEKIHMIVAGILLKDNRFLVEKRKHDNKIDPGIVCFPGGHIREGEKLEEAIKREMKEELGILIRNFKHIYTGICTDSIGMGKAQIHYFKITDWSGEIKCSEAEKVFWESNHKKLDTEIDKKALLKLNKLDRR